LFFTFIDQKTIAIMANQTFYFRVNVVDVSPVVFGKFTPTTITSGFLSQFDHLL